MRVFLVRQHERLSRFINACMEAYAKAETRASGLHTLGFVSRDLLAP